jgi:hypothetical protein
LVGVPSFVEFMRIIKEPSIRRLHNIFKHVFAFFCHLPSPSIGPEGHMETVKVLYADLDPFHCRIRHSVAG